VCVCVCVHLYACVPEKEISIVIRCRPTPERNKARQKYGKFASTLDNCGSQILYYRL